MILTKRFGMSCTLALMGALSVATTANGQDTVYLDDLPPEVRRLVRHAHDYANNSNRNVFRSSRHFHPTRNVFRSSRHYRQKLAAAPEARRRRTFIRFSERIDDGPRRLREYSYAHHQDRFYRR